MKPSNPTPSINCYSDGEGAFMIWGQKVRATLLAPLLKILGNNGVRAGHITFLSLLSGLAFCPLFIQYQYTWALVFLALHVLLDGLDGPLARYLGRDGNRGSFTDTVADQIVVTAVTITLIYTWHAEAWPGGCYLFLYTVVVAFSMIRNAISAPYSWLFRPRFLIYGWLVIELYFWSGTIDVVLWIATALLGLKAITGFIAIRKSL